MLYNSSKLGTRFHQYCRPQPGNLDEFNTPAVEENANRMNYTALKIIGLYSISLSLFCRHSNIFVFCFVVGAIHRTIPRDAKKSINDFYQAFKRTSVPKKVIVLCGLTCATLRMLPGALVAATIYQSAILGLDLFEYCRGRHGVLAQ